MKTRIESNGKTHTVHLVAENVFEQACIDAVHVYQTKAEVSKEATDPTAVNLNGMPKYDTLVITMEDK